MAIAEGGEVRSAGRIEAKPAELRELFAQSLGKTDRVALEVTGNAWEIKRLLEPHVGVVVVVSPNDTGISSARAKTDRLDARTLAKLCAAGELDAVWVPDRRTPGDAPAPATAKPASRRAHAGKERDPRGADAPARRPGAVHGPVRKKGRRWLAELELAEVERESVDAALRQVEFLDAEIAEVERLIPAAEALAGPRSGG